MYSLLCNIIIFGTIFFTYGECQGQISERKVNYLCGLTKEQVSEALSWPEDNIKGVAVNEKCLSSEQVNDNCIKEQYDLIKCLTQERDEAISKENEIYTQKDINNEHYVKQNIKNSIIPEVIEANKLLDEVTKDYKQIVNKRLQTLDDLAAKRECIYTLKTKLISYSNELIFKKQKELLACNIGKIKSFGLYPPNTCVQPLQQIHLKNFQAPYYYNLKTKLKEQQC